MRWLWLTVLLLAPNLTAAAEAPPDPGQAPERVRAWQSGVISADRLQHASVSLTSGLAIGVLSREPAAAFGGAMILGLAKEVWDLPRTGFDPGDLAADAVGALLAGLATRAIEP